eukprot:52972_1
MQPPFDDHNMERTPSPNVEAGRLESSAGGVSENLDRQISEETISVQPSEETTSPSSPPGDSHHTAYIDLEIGKETIDVSEDVESADLSGDASSEAGPDSAQSEGSLDQPAEWPGIDLESDGHTDPDHPALSFLTSTSQQQPAMEPTETVSETRSSSEEPGGIDIEDTGSNGIDRAAENVSNVSNPANKTSMTFSHTVVARDPVVGSTE